MTTIEPKTEFRPAKALGRTAEAARVPPLVTAPRSLVEVIREEVARVPESSLVPVAPPSAGLAHQPRVLLAMLGYCYAHGVYGSEHIEDSLRRDAAFRWICGNEFPDARLLRKFRRSNREALNQILQAALRFIGECRVEAGGEPLGSEVVAEEATGRILKAMFIDSVELDGDAAP